MVSYKYDLNKEDMLKVGKGMLIASAGVLTPALVETGSVLLNYLFEVIPLIDCGKYSSVVMIVSSVLINVGRKYISGLKQRV